MPPSQTEIIRCSFCGLFRQDVEHMIQGPGPLYICDQCIDLAVELIADARQERKQDKKTIVYGYSQLPLWIAGRRNYRLTPCATESENE